MALSLIPFKSWNPVQNSLEYGFYVVEDGKEEWDWNFQLTVGVISGGLPDEEWMEKQADLALEKSRWAAEAIVAAAATR